MGVEPAWTGLTGPASPPKSRRMPHPAWILCQPLAGMQAQALGFAGALDLDPELKLLEPPAPWRYVTARLWPAPLRVVGLDAAAAPDLVLGCGGTAAPVGAALRRPGRQVVHVQHPRMDPARFDVVVVTRHDGLTGPNVIVTRTALHAVTPARLAAARAEWAPVLAHLPRPLVAVLVGGSNGRYRLDARVAADLGQKLAGMMRLDRVGLALTPSRRTAPAATEALARAVRPLGGWVWDGQGANPYFGLLALADAIIVTADSVSMISEAVATAAPVMLAPLPGHSRRQGRFARMLVADGRVRRYEGRLELWPAAPLDDTAEAAAETRRRLGL